MEEFKRTLCLTDNNDGTMTAVIQLADDEEAIFTMVIPLSFDDLIASVDLSNETQKFFMENTVLIPNNADDL